MAQAGPPPPGAAGATQPSASAAEQTAGQTGVSGFVGSLIPGFNFAATVNLAETYATNASGFSTGGRSDWITNAGIGLTMNNHSARVSFDANYNGSIYYYANDTQSVQFYNDLQALGTVIVIPDYVNFNARAFAQPIATSNVGIVTAGGNQGANGFNNSYGFSGGPDITFRLGASGPVMVFKLCAPKDENLATICFDSAPLPLFAVDQAKLDEEVGAIAGRNDFQRLQEQARELRRWSPGSPASSER